MRHMGHGLCMSPLRRAVPCKAVIPAGYALFQVPGTMLCAKVGAPRFLGVSLVAWGAIAASFATLRSPRQFYVLRFVLGLAETAAYPGARARLCASAQNAGGFHVLKAARVLAPQVF